MAEYLVTLSLLILTLLVVRGLFRKSISPTVMYALWLVVVLRLCLPFPLFRVEMDLPARQEAISQEQQEQQGAVNPGIDPDTITPPVADTPSVPDTPSVSIPTTPTVPSMPANPTVPGENPIPDVPDVPVIPEVPPAPPAPIDWMRVAVTVWIAGSAILALWFAVTGCVYHYRLVTHRTLYKTLRKTKVYLTEDESAPCLAGVIPAIYIPPVEMDEDSRAFIVLHEYMHLRHGDHVWAVVRILALIAHWWNPLVWAAVILSRRDAELACDHAVAAQLNRENRLEYARILLDTIPQKHRYAVGLGSSPMKERILRLTKTQKNRILCVVLAVIITAAAVGCSFIGWKEKEGETVYDIDTLCEHIRNGTLSALELFSESNEEYLNTQFANLHAYYSGTSEKRDSDWEAMPDAGVILPGEFSFKNCEKFEYSTASQTPVVLRYDVGDYWLYAGFTLLDVGTTGDVSEILWHLSEAWFIPQSDQVQPFNRRVSNWNIYYTVTPGIYTHGGYRCSDVKLFHIETGESYRETVFTNDSTTGESPVFAMSYENKLLMECTSHGFVIFDLSGGLYDSLSSSKDFYIAYNNEFGAYIPGTAQWINGNQLQAQGEQGAFFLTISDGTYTIESADLTQPISVKTTTKPVDALPADAETALYSAAPVGGNPRYYIFQKGDLTYYRHNAATGEILECTMTLPDMFTWSRFCFASAGAGSGEVHLYVETSAGVNMPVLDILLLSDSSDPVSVTILDEAGYQELLQKIHPPKETSPGSHGPFIGYVADKTTPWIDLYTEKNGTYVGRIPYEIFHDWVATDRNSESWTPGWEPEYVHFYYAEFGDFRWAAAHLTDTVLGNGRKNVATSTDGGLTWNVGSTADDYGGNHVIGMGFISDQIAFMSFDPDNEFYDPDNDGVPSRGPAISRTIDGGKTWERLDFTVPDELANYQLKPGIPFYEGDTLLYPIVLYSGGKPEDEAHLVSYDNGLTWKWESRQPGTQGGTESLSGVLSCVLRGEDAFYDTAAKRRAYLTDWLRTNEMFVSKYSVIDLNGDGASELVLWLNRGTNEYVGFLVLYDENTTVYTHLLYYRQFSNLKEDGTFGFSGGVSNHGIGRIDFEGDKYTIRSLAYCESADNQNVSYFVDGKSVSKAAFEAYENAQSSKPDAIWVDCSIEAAPGYKQYTPAIDIDTAKLDYIKPMAMYGESQPESIFNRTANIYPGTGFEGYADGVGYITFGVCNDRKSPDYVSRYYTYRVTSAGGYIISVEEAETITRDIVLKKGKPYTGSLEGRHTCVVNNRYYGITISGNTISASVGLYQTDAGGTGKGTYTYDPATGKMTITTIEKYHDGNGNLLVNSPKTVTGKLYEYGDMVHFLYDDAKATPLPLSFPKINAFPPDRTDFIFDDLAGGWYHSFRDEKGDQFYCLALDPETQQICFAHGFYDGSYAARYVGTYRVDYNRIIHATLQDNNDPSAGEMKFIFSMGYSMGRDETGEMRTTINITPQVCDMENYRDMLGRYFGFTRARATTEELTERAEQYNFVMSAYETAAEAAVMFYTAGSVDTADSVLVDGATYFRVEGFDTPNDLRLYMEAHFDSALIDRFLTGKDAAKYIHHEGKLYVIPGTLPENSRLGERYYTVSKVKDDWYILNVTVEVLDTKDLSTVLAYQHFQFDYQYKNGKWVFTQFPHIQ